ncbi:MAG: pyrroline-5-carboxylate reductase [Treponema sp.]|jgi:pyrroline-5-carboxylate reductase|nr:pyrroline-5-carboxylate reductase [Treponema sp.]
MSTIACIGSGNMGLALMKGASRTAGSTNIFFTDADAEKARAAAGSLGAGVNNSNLEAINNGDFVFLAVKPQVLPQVLAEIAPIAGKRFSGGGSHGDLPILVSMAAGWSIGKIQAAVGAKLPVVRIMPNTPALIGKGMIALAASPEVPAERTAELENILGGAGIVDRLDERYMDAATGLSGSGPAFVYLFIEALADGGVRAGLPRDKALRYAVQTVLGSAAMVEETGKHPGELKDMVTSPNGTTIAGLTALEGGAFRGTVIKAVEAAWRRSMELG